MHTVAIIGLMPEPPPIEGGAKLHRDADRVELLFGAAC